MGNNSSNETILTENYYSEHSEKHARHRANIKFVSLAVVASILVAILVSLVVIYSLNRENKKQDQIEAGLQEILEDEGELIDLSAISGDLKIENAGIYTLGGRLDGCIQITASEKVTLRLNSAEIACIDNVAISSSEKDANIAFELIDGTQSSITVDGEAAVAVEIEGNLTISGENGALIIEDYGITGGGIRANAWYSLPSSSIDGKYKIESGTLVIFNDSQTDLFIPTKESQDFYVFNQRARENGTYFAYMNPEVSSEKLFSFDSDRPFRHILFSSEFVEPSIEYNLQFESDNLDQ